MVGPVIVVLTRRDRDEGGMMVVEITETTLKRLDNYASVLLKEQREAERFQWRVMTCEVMQAAEKARTRAREVSAIVAYARYLQRIQSGLDHPRYIYGEPQLSQALGALMTELSIERNMVADRESVTNVAAVSRSD